jgi:NAD(P)-dependent dehydrogenase (short-subunit alcohol dehydrogenase family)
VTPGDGRRFEGKVALVTGSSRNLGKAIAAGFAREGAHVVINARESADELDITAAEFRDAGWSVLPVLADLADRRAAFGLVERTVDELGRLDILMITHSVRPLRPFLEISEEEWHWVMGINLHSKFHLLQAVIPRMLEQGGGHVIAIGGGTRQRGEMNLPRPNPRPHAFAAHEASNALYLMLMREFATQGIRFNFVSPGIMDTFRKNPEWYPGGAQDDPQVIARIPMGRPGTPEELADAVLWLASPAAEYVWGTTLGVNGGWSI